MALKKVEFERSNEDILRHIIDTYSSWNARKIPPSASHASATQMPSPKLNAAPPNASCSTSITNQPNQATGSSPHASTAFTHISAAENVMSNKRSTRPVERYDPSPGPVTKRQKASINRPIAPSIVTANLPLGTTSPGPTDSPNSPGSGTKKKYPHSWKGYAVEATLPDGTTRILEPSDEIRASLALQKERNPQKAGSGSASLATSSQLPSAVDIINSETIWRARMSQVEAKQTKEAADRAEKSRKQSEEIEAERNKERERWRNEQEKLRMEGKEREKGYAEEDKKRKLQLREEEEEIAKRQREENEERRKLGDEVKRALETFQTY